MMLLYELKKVFCKASNRIALLLLLFLLGIVCYFAVSGVNFVDENGDSQWGIAAIRKLKEVKEEWAGDLTEEHIAKVIAENNRINATGEFQSDNVQKNDISFGWKQGFSDIRFMLVNSFCKFREYDYYIADSLKPEDAGKFYSNRILHLKEWLDTEAEFMYSENEKAYLVQQYEALKIPMKYDYADGWNQLFEYAVTVVMFTVLFLGFLTGNIFSCEFQLKSDSIFYSAYHGRGKAAAAKVIAGLVLTTVIYWGIMALYSIIVLGILGPDGASCPIQTSISGWKSFHNITNLQKYALVCIGGYLGCLFSSLLTMLVSAKSRSAVLAVTVPFVLIFIPSFLSGIDIPALTKLLGLLPDQLMQMSQTLSLFNLYEIGGKVADAVKVLFGLYTMLIIVMCPVLYQIYRKSQIK